MSLTAQTLFAPRVSFLEKLLFTKHLAVMIKSGIVTSEALEILIDRTKSPSFKKILSEILKDILNGQTLAKSLGKHPQVFDQFYLGLIEVGEEAGTLEQNLEYLAGQLAKEYDLRKKIQGAFLYPAVVLSATLIMGGFLSLFILPQLVNFFDAFSIELPLTTRILLAVANFMKYYGLFFIGGILLLLAGLTGIIRITPIKKIWQLMVLRIPILGILLFNGQLVRFTRNLGTLLKSGIPIIRSLEITSLTMNYLVFKEALTFTKEEILKGKQLASGLEDFRYKIFFLSKKNFSP